MKLRLENVSVKQCSLFSDEFPSFKQSNTGGSGGAGHWYALKRQLAADRQAAEAIVREIKFLIEAKSTRTPVVFTLIQIAW
uniref:Uncharacterized protein n=1 Tax=Globodera rostochiensis TaxID=31243 RepID=A0A914HLP7_GLORO